MFSNNIANSGGATLFYGNGYIDFREHSTTIFSNNTADKCGAILVDDRCRIMFDCNSSVLFENNTAAVGETMFCIHDSNILVKDYASIIFNNVLAKWCVNVSLPYPGETDAIMIDNNGLVWCNNLQAFNCLSDKFYCKALENKLGGIKNNQIINITDDVVVLSSVVHINSHNVSIIGHNNPTVICVNDSGLQINEVDNLTIEYSATRHEP